MAERSEPGWLLFFALVALYSWPSSKQAESVVVYKAFCNMKVDSVCADEHPAEQANFKASFENQTVVLWHENTAPVAIEHCVVADGENWQCKDKNDPFHNTFTMIDGVFSQKGDLFVEFIYPIGKWKWRWLKLRDWTHQNLRPEHFKQIML